MKPSTMVLAAVTMAAMAAPAPAQLRNTPAGNDVSANVAYPQAAINKIEGNYLACFASHNNGVVESAIAQTVRMKWAIPSARLGELRTALDKLAADGTTPAIKYKAYLAGMVFDAPSMFQEESAQKYMWDEDLFDAVSARAQKALLGCNTGSPEAR
ncbi:MAG TPA: hypothetical protein VL126_09870 [Bacteroidota bacterium]|nr:hypothetical protein [Bacteroidota bacterium]